MHAYTLKHVLHGLVVRGRGGGHLEHGAVVVVVPVEVQLVDADAGGVGAGQQHRGAVCGLQEGHLPRGHLQAVHTPGAWRGSTAQGQLQTEPQAAGPPGCGAPRLRGPQAAGPPGCGAPRLRGPQAAEPPGCGASRLRGL